MRYLRHAGLWICAASAACCGCQTTKVPTTNPLSQTLQGTVVPTPPGGAPGQPAAGFGLGNSSVATAEAPPAADPWGSMPQQAVATSAGTGGVVLASLKQAGSTVTEALRIPTKITPAEDPVKLDNGPEDSKSVAADLHFHAGSFFESQRKLVEAATHYRDALKIKPEDARCLTALGRVEDNLGNFPEAEGFLRRGCELAPQDPSAWSELGQAYAGQRDWNRALPCAQQAVNLQPHSQMYRHRLAGLMLDMGKGDEALQVLQPLGAAQAQFQLGLLLHDRKATDQARLHVQRAAELDPRMTIARQTLERWQATAWKTNGSDGERTSRFAQSVSTRLPTP